MIVPILKEVTLHGCDNWRGVYVLSANETILSKIILEHIKEHLEILIDREQASFRSWADHTNRKCL